MKNLLRKFQKEGWEGEEIADISANRKKKEDKGDSQLAEITELVYQTDPGNKALTGRTPERILEETGIPKEQMFPENAKILYVGDPWQRMGKSLDNPDLTIIDYEFGDVASFITDNETFRYSITLKSEHLLLEILRLKLKADKQLDQPQTVWLNQFEQLINMAQTLSDTVKSLDDYKKVAQAWQEAREFIESQYKKDMENIDETKSGDPGSQIDEYDAFSIFRKEAWYTCIYGERGFKDIPDFYNLIMPKINGKKSRLLQAGISEEEVEKEIAKSLKGWIEEIRLKKIPQHANVVEAVFPALPFKANSFDRFVASWSISAHTFSELDKSGFAKYWEEIQRVLKRGGEAYIFPLSYSNVDEQAFEDSLKEFAGQNSLEWKYLDHHGQAVPDFWSAYTLCLKKQALPA